MALQVSHFPDNMTIKEFYETLGYLAEKQMQCLNKMEANSIHSGKYIDAKIMLKEWHDSWEAAYTALTNIHGQVIAESVRDMVNSDIEMQVMRDKLFAETGCTVIPLKFQLT